MPGLNLFISAIPLARRARTQSVLPSKTILIRRYQYSILENNIIGGLCEKCKTKIPGVWD